MLTVPMRPRYIPIALLVSYLGAAFGQDAPAIIFQPGRISQPPSRSAARRTVAGTVVNSVTGEPIRRALVNVNGSETHSAFTAADGRFEVPNVPEGQVFLTTQKPGFFDSSASAGSPFQAPPARITLGPATGDVVLRLSPEAKIRGRVLDRSGEPIEFLNVQLLAQVVVEGRKQWQQRNQATTDEAGIYLIDNLMPGAYVLRTVPLPIQPVSTAKVANGAPGSEVFQAKYYPDAPDLSSVQPIELKPGQELPVDFTLSSAPAFRISGVVSGGGQDQAGVMCQDSEGQSPNGMTVVLPGGRFAIESVPPGAWTVHAFSQREQEGTFEADQPIEVTASDIKGLTLQLQPLPSIAVHVQNWSEHQGIVVNLMSTAGNQNHRFNAYQGPGGQPGSLSLNGVSPGVYRVTVQVADRSACIDSVTSGSNDLTRNELTVLAGSQPAPIEVTLRTDCATISGSVHSSSQLPSNSFVVLVSDSSVTSQQPVQAGADGKFSLTNLTPGAYRLFAFNDISDLEYANPEALRDFTGQQVTLGPNEKTNVQLDLVTRAK